MQPSASKMRILQPTHLAAATSIQPKQKEDEEEVNVSHNKQ